MDEFLEDLKSGEIQFRDRWQFELKSEFSPKSAEKESSYLQEFYFFIPNALQITPETYSKEDFYKDITNLIRYKTPLIPLSEISDLLQFFKEDHSSSELQMELKLIGNIFRSSLRNAIQNILHFSDPPEKEVRELCSEIREFRKEFKTVLQEKKLQEPELKVTCGYLDEFIRNSIDYYLTGLLDQFQMHKSPVPKEVENHLCSLILEEKNKIPMKEKEYDEKILYRISLLNKYFLDALLLHVDRISVQERYGSWISGFSATVAMLVYLLLFIWQGQWFVINSFPFIAITVVAYVLKVRLKESLQALSYRHAFGYFYDYKTKILSPQEDYVGELKESFTFVDENDIPEEIRKIRNFEFHAMLKTFKRPEQVIYFKRIIKVYPSKDKLLKSLNISLRYNLQNYLEKASDPHHSFMKLDGKTKTILKLRLPKVYHVNVIIKNQFLSQNEKPVVELRKYRIILDKNGIKNIEQIRA